MAFILPCKMLQISEVKYNTGTHITKTNDSNIKFWGNYRASDASKST